MPIRTCMVTRKKVEQNKLFRFTVVAEELQFDPLGLRRPGRGGYVCPTVEAIRGLLKLEKKLSHFLRTPVRVSSETIEAQVGVISD